MFSNTLIYYIAALMGAICWAAGSLAARKAVKKIGEIPFVTLRMLTSYLVMRFFCFLTDRSFLFSLNEITWISLSGFIGIFLGDSCLFSCMRRVGPRKAQLIFSFHAPFTAILAYLVFNEIWNYYQFLGTFFVCLGIFTAIFTKKEDAFFENLPLPKMLLPIFLGIIAAFSQAVGALLIKPVFQNANADFITVATFRIGVATLSLILFLSKDGLKVWKKITGPILLGASANGFLSMILGVTLVVFALSGGEAGIVATLSATSPIMILPMLWIIDKKKPSFFAFLGALFVVSGCWFLFFFS